jgi:hypothetical protein
MVTWVTQEFRSGFYFSRFSVPSFFRAIGKSLNKTRKEGGEIEGWKKKRIGDLFDVEADARL